VPEDEVDGDLDTMTECEGDCDDTDSSLESLDQDADGYTTCQNDCDDLDAAFNPSVAEFCADWVDNDCNGLTDYEEETPPCSAYCGAPDMAVDPIVTDGSFEGPTLFWFQIPTGLPSDDDADPFVTNLDSVEGDSALAITNLTQASTGNPNGIDEDRIGVEVVTDPGSYLLAFASRTEGVNGANLRIRVVDTQNPSTEFCSIPTTTLGTWVGRYACCTLGAVAGSYTVQMSYGWMHPAATLYLDAVGLYPVTP
jgi:hypothetical protein